MKHLKIAAVYLPALLILVSDQAAKQWAVGLFGGSKTLLPGLLNARYVRNHGGLFGLLDPVASPADGLILNGIIGLALTVLVVAARRTPWTKTVRHLGFACMIGGASSNLLDRLLHGYVVDFLAVGGLPIINPADLALAAGVMLVCGDILFLTKDSG